MGTGRVSRFDELAYVALLHVASYKPRPELSDQYHARPHDTSTNPASFWRNRSRGSIAFELHCYLFNLSHQPLMSEQLTPFNDSLRIDPQFLATAVDHYVVPKALRMQIKFAGSDATVIGREILVGGTGAPEFDKVLSVNSIDSDLDARLRAGLGKTPLIMGKSIADSLVNYNFLPPYGYAGYG
ncbi:glucose dehydrogenase [Seiridium cupressi]